MAVENRLVAHARDWGVAIRETRSTETSLLGFGVRGNEPVVLKVIRKENSEEWNCGEVLEAFRGQGMIRPLKYIEGAVLMPLLQPGYDLASLYDEGRDDEATEIIVCLLEKLSAVTGMPTCVGSVDRLLPDFSTFRDGAHGFFPSTFVDRAESLFGELCMTQSKERLLHGDLHHFNVLFDQREGWVSIDPWGVKGELEFELGPSLRNPIPRVSGDIHELERRVRTYGTRLKLNETRVLQWAFAATVLAVLWPFDPLVGQDLRKPFARAATAMWDVLGY